MIKINVGSALTDIDSPPDDFPVNGRDLMTGIQRILLFLLKIAHAIDKSISKIEEAILKALETTPPNWQLIFFKTGLDLTGGGQVAKEVWING